MSSPFNQAWTFIKKYLPSEMIVHVPKHIKDRFLQHLLYAHRYQDAGSSAGNIALEKLREELTDREFDDYFGSSNQLQNFMLGIHRETSSAGGHISDDAKDRILSTIETHTGPVHSGNYVDLLDIPEREQSLYEKVGKRMKDDHLKQREFKQSQLADHYDFKPLEEIRHLATPKFGFMEQDRPHGGATKVRQFFTNDGPRSLNYELLSANNVPLARVIGAMEKDGDTIHDFYGTNTEAGAKQGNYYKLLNAILQSGKAILSDDRNPYSQKFHEKFQRNLPANVDFDVNSVNQELIDAVYTNPPKEIYSWNAPYDYMLKPAYWIDRKTIAMNDDDAFKDREGRNMFIGGMNRYDYGALPITGGARHFMSFPQEDTSTKENFRRISSYESDPNNPNRRFMRLDEFSE